MSEGWIKLHRQIQHNDIWTKEPFSRGQAWIDLILLANHKDGFIYVRGNKINIKRGQVAWSQKRLAERWQWSRGKVARFLQDLENEGQIEQQKNFITSLVTISKYIDYQKTDSKRTADRAADGQQTEQQTDTNKNVKNEKNVKNTTPLPPSREEVLSYFLENGYPKKTANDFFDYYEASREGNGRVWRDSKGNTVKNWKQKARGVWFKDENKHPDKIRVPASQRFL